MHAAVQPLDTQRYARCIEVSKRVRWEIDQDVIRGRSLDFGQKFLPDGLSLAPKLAFLTDAERRFFSQVQGRTYGNMFAMVERFASAKILEISRAHWLGDQVALEALVRFADEELKHQVLFRRLERMAGAGMPTGYVFMPEPNEVAGLVLGKSTWAVLALTCLIELMSQAHYRQSIEPETGLSEVWKDVFLFHWKEESQHAVLDELEWMRENAHLTGVERDAAVDDLVALLAAVDGTVRAQAKSDAAYFLATCWRRFEEAEARAVREAFFAAYRLQYVVSGARLERFRQILGGMLTGPQAARVGEALKPIVEYVEAAEARPPSTQR